MGVILKEVIQDRFLQQWRYMQIMGCIPLHLLWLKLRIGRLGHGLCRFSLMILGLKMAKARYSLQISKMS